MRPLSEGDGPALQRFNAGLWEQTRSTFLPHGYDEITVANYIERSSQEIDRAYVVLGEEEVIGYFFLWNTKEPTAVLGIGITDAYQDQSLGTQMMEILIEDAKAIGLEGIELTTVLDNERAFGLYRKMGFRYLYDVDNVAGDGRVVRERAMFLPLRVGAKPQLRKFGPPV